MNAERKLKVVVLAGPNGAGKSTASLRLLRGPLRVNHFVNADVIAQGLSALDPNQAAMAAGRIMMKRLKELAATRDDFAFETTLASRSFAPWLTELKSVGYEVHLVFLWLPSADAAVKRVAERVSLGGHDVPEATIRRRYHNGLRNFFERYQSLANSCQVIDNSVVGKPRLVATGSGMGTDAVKIATVWARIVPKTGKK